MQPLLVVRLLTYNHEEYIRQCLDGILIQQTNFPFIVIIGEDCSTDQTAKICKEYESNHPDIFKLRCNKINNLQVNSINNWELCLLSKAKYIALLEGDDYWTDPCKLQKQVDFLDANPTFALCTTKYTINNGKDIIFPDIFENLFEGNENYQITMDNFLNPYALKTLCVVFRSEFLNPNLFSKKYFSDLFIWADLLSKGKGVCLNFVGGVYRLHNTGIWSALNDIDKATENYNLAKAMESSFGYRYNSLKNFRTQQAQQLYNLLKEKKQLSNSEKKIMLELVNKKIIAKAKRLFNSIFSNNN